MLQASNNRFGGAWGDPALTPAAQPCPQASVWWFRFAFQITSCGQLSI